MFNSYIEVDLYKRLKNRLDVYSTSLNLNSVERAALKSISESLSTLMENQNYLNFRFVKYFF